MKFSGSVLVADRTTTRYYPVMSCFTEKHRRALREASYESDRAARQYAEKVWNDLLRYVKRWGHRLTPVLVGTGPQAMSGYIVQGPAGGLPAGLSVMLLPPKASTKGSYGKNPQLGHTITIYGVTHDSDDPTEIADNFASSAYHDFFVHEFVHYLDQLRYKGAGVIGADSKRALDRGDVEGYFRSAAEFNAYYQEIASAVESWVDARLDDTRTVGPEMRPHIQEQLQKIFASYVAFRRYMTKDFARTMFQMQDLDQALKGTKWGKKLEKRLVSLYQGLKTKVEDALNKVSD